jgi:hypothetical protein
MRAISLVVCIFLAGFGAGWFSGDRRTTRHFTLMNLGYQLRIHAAATQTNVAQIKDVIEQELACTVLDAWACGLLDDKPVLPQKIRTATAVFSDPEQKEQIESVLASLKPNLN